MLISKKKYEEMLLENARLKAENAGQKAEIEELMSVKDRWFSKYCELHRVIDELEVTGYSLYELSKLRKKER